MSEARLRDIPDWIWTLSVQERELLQALVRVYPRPASEVYLDGVIGHKEHASERCGSLIATIVSRIRTKLPVGGIERVRGIGYRLSPEAAAVL